MRALPSRRTRAQIVQEAQRPQRSKSQRYEGVLAGLRADAQGRPRKIAGQYAAALGSHGDSKPVLRFTAPAEVKGVALLVVNHPDRASDQWMWTPAIERDRRIALQDRSTRFFGTDFSFEDLEERDVDQYDYTLLGEETVDGAACWKIESRPKQSKTSQYTQSPVWIRKDNYVARSTRTSSRTRSCAASQHPDIQNVQGIWTARTLEMTDLRRKSRTVLRSRSCNTTCR